MLIPKNLLFLRNLFRSFKPDIVNVFHSVDHQYAMVTRDSRHTKLVRTRGGYRAAKRNFANVYLHQKSASANIACADFISDKHFPALGIDSDKVHTIRPGIDLEEFQKGAVDKSAALDLLGLSSANRWVGHIARFSEVKAHRLVLEAFTKLPEPLRSRTRLLCAGIEYDVKIKDLENYAAQLGIADRVVFSEGKRFDVRVLLSALDLVLIPSLSSEAISRVAMEALALGVPTVASELNSLPEILGDIGLLYPTGDVARMAEAIARGLSEPDLRARVEVEGPERIAKRYSRVEKLKLTEELFYKL